PSKHRYRPPSMRIGVSSHGTNWLSSRATTMMTALFPSEPRAIRRMIGNSREGSTPRTYCGVTAVSSTTTPAAFTLARPAAAAMSSVLAAAALASTATSSSSAARPPAMGTSSTDRDVGDVHSSAPMRAATDRHRVPLLPMMPQSAVPARRYKLRGVLGVAAVLAALVAINLAANLADLPRRELVVPFSVLALVVVVKGRGMRWSELGLSPRHMPRGFFYGLAATVAVAAVVTAGCLIPATSQFFLSERYSDLRM